MFTLFIRTLVEQTLYTRPPPSMWLRVHTKPLCKKPRFFEFCIQWNQHWKCIKINTNNYGPMFHTIAWDMSIFAIKHLHFIFIQPCLPKSLKRINCVFTQKLRPLLCPIKLTKGYKCISENCCGFFFTLLPLVSQQTDGHWLTSATNINIM